MIDNHLLDFAKKNISQNQNERPNNEITLIVIHNISLPPGQFNNNNIEDFFTNKLDNSSHAYFEKIKDLKVSAHLLIKRSGEVVQFVAFNKRAWHAGESSFKSRNNCNDFSIGIELEGSDNITYEPVQYKELNKIISILKSNYPIADIVGHSDIAPGRKTDPGESFEWSKINETTK